jgi:hypothetical protein
MGDPESTESSADEDVWEERELDMWIVQMMGVAATWKGGDLYHYTTIGGLQGILEKACLWGTHLAFLNDSRELDYGVDAICGMIRNYAAWYVSDEVLAKAENPDNNRFMRDLFEAVCTFLERNKDELKPDRSPFVSCLSTSRDQLSQWRGYGQTGGYAIRFAPDLLSSSLKHVDEQGSPHDGPDPVLVKVEYLTEHVYDEVSKMALDHINEFMEANKIEGERQQDEARTSARFNLLRKVIEIAARLKHHKFAEEQEHRIITHGTEDIYTPSKLGLVPRVLVQFDPSAIKEIMVGPGEFAEVRKLSIDRYIERNARRYGSVEVTLSEVPYREL